MNIHTFAIPRMLAGVAIAAGIFASGLHAQEPEVMTRGPVHEAFAGTVEFDPEVGATVRSAPPEPIDEVPPDQQPDGDNVTWIPGYWAWDEEAEEFLWISGVWRNLPPGREWVPGYWAQNGDEYQWTSGYWEDEEAQEVTYLPAPPKTQERGPNVEAPSNNHSWVPGNWVYQDEDYSWRPGYWAPAREDWSWTPAYYRWTPRGYTYVDGYWDYPVERRGVVFAPVRIQREYYSRPDYSYSPVTAIAVAVFANHLFVRPSHNHYYFGDYYEPRYRDRGYYASYDYYSRRRGYDPIFARYRWENRNDRNWERGRREYFEYRRDHADARPPRTWRAFDSRPYSDRERRDFATAERYDRLVARGDGRQKFRRVSADEKVRYVSQRQEIRKFGKERAQMESRRDAMPNKDRKSVREKAGKSPVIAKKGNRAPERLQARASERDNRLTKGGNKDNGPKGGDQARREEMNKRGDGPNGKATNNRGDGPNRQPGKAGDGPKKADNNRGDGGKAKGNGGETRTTPGQRREPQKANNGNNGGTKKNDGPGKNDGPARNNPNPPKREGAGDGKKQQANPERREAPKRQEANPGPKKQQANPAPKKQQANPAPKKQQAQPSAPKRQAQPSAPKRQAQPSAPKKQDGGANRGGGDRKEQSAAPRKAQQTAAVRNNNAPKRQQAANNAPKRQQVSASAPTRKQQANNAPKRQQQKAAPQQASRQKAASPSGKKAANRTESAGKKDSGKGNKKKD